MRVYMYGDHTQDEQERNGGEEQTGRQAATDGKVRRCEALVPLLLLLLLGSVPAASCAMRSV
jgi:hypothetical protein